MTNLLQCKICGFEGRSLITHLKYKHYITTDEYKSKYNEKIVYLHSDELKKKISNTLKFRNKDLLFRKENSDRQKNGCSIFTKKYWMNKGFSEEKAIKQISELQKENSSKRLNKTNFREASVFCVEYWIKRGNTEIEAIAKIRNLQSKLSFKSSKFLGHVRTDKQKEKISNSLKIMIDKLGRGIWAKHFGDFNGRSKVEVEMYDYIKNNINSSVKANVPIGNYIVDIIKDKKIIEFYGDFWHGNPSLFDKHKMLNDHLGGVRMVQDIWKRDEDRITYLKNSGYSVLVIWEMDWKKNKQESIDRIKEYLT